MDVQPRDNQYSRKELSTRRSKDIHTEIMRTKETDKRVRREKLQKHT
jgi:hypothetical protein